MKRANSSGIAPRRGRHLADGGGDARRRRPRSPRRRPPLRGAPEPGVSARRRRGPGRRTAAGPGRSPRGRWAGRAHGTGASGPGCGGCSRPRRRSAQAGSRARPRPASGRAARRGTAPGRAPGPACSRLDRSCSRSSSTPSNSETSDTHSSVRSGSLRALTPLTRARNVTSEPARLAERLGQHGRSLGDVAGRCPAEQVIETGDVGTRPDLVEEVGGGDVVDGGAQRGRGRQVDQHEVALAGRAGHVVELGVLRPDPIDLGVDLGGLDVRHVDLDGAGDGRRALSASATG